MHNINQGKAALNSALLYGLADPSGNINDINRLFCVDFYHRRQNGILIAIEYFEGRIRAVHLEGMDGLNWM